MSSFGGSIKLTGEDEYRRALKNITTGLREVSSQLSLTTTQFDNSDKKTKDLKQAQQELSKIYETQKAKVDELRNAYNSFSQKVSEQSQKHKDLVNEYDKEKAELDKLGSTLGTTSKEYQDQKAKVENLSKEVAKSTKNEDENTRALSKMGTELNNAEKDLSNTEKEMKNLGKETKNTGDGFTVFKGILANLGTQAINSALNGLKSLGSALINVGKQAIESYADYEQLTGGVETLFEDSADIVKNYANEAYKTAGLSANEYMETVTSFSASLISSLGGDTKKASEYSNRAIIDMSDNANKMGTDISMIQNAYQGFAKQNYTMLDNLKLGYGGTKTEMARLIQDASKLTDVQKELGITVDANDMSFGNIVNAISVVQKNMGIMGTTTEEASKTISGSVNAMKSSWKNLLTGIADDNANFGDLINNFVDSIMTVANNLLPRIQQVISGLGELVSQLLTTLVPELIQMIPPLIQESLPILLNAVQTAIQSILDVFPMIVDSLSTLIPTIVQMLISMLPQLLDVGIKSITSIIQGITNALPQLIAMLPTLIKSIVDTLLANLPLIIQTGVELLVALINGLADAIPQLIDYIPEIIETIITVLIDNLPLIVDCALKIMMALIQGLSNALPKLVAKVPEIIKTIVNTLVNNLPQIINAGVQIIKSLVSGISNMRENVRSMISKIKDIIINTIKNLPSDMLEIGKNLVRGIFDGISNMSGWLFEKIKGFKDQVLNKFKSFFGIQSPSKLFRDEIGTYLAQGIGEGFTDEMANVSKDMEQAIPTNLGSDIAVNGASLNSSSSFSNEYSYTRIVEAFQDALSSMKIELDDEEAGRFVRRTVEQAIYT